MKKIFLFGWIFFCGMSVAQLAIAQDQEEGEETITLRKKGSFPDDVTIHIEGDKITINGEAPKDVDVIREKSEGGTSGNSFRSYQQRRGGSGEGFRFSPEEKDQEDMALLGVLTSVDESTRGARVEDVEEGTPADSAGLKRGDLITMVNGKTVTSPMDLSDMVQSFKPGDKIDLTYKTGKTEQTVSVVLGSIKSGIARGGQNRNFGNFYGNAPSRGFPQEDLQRWFEQLHPRMDRNPNLRMFGDSGPKLGVVVEENRNPKGAKVTHVSPHSAAEAAGVEEGDILTSFGGEAIESVEDLKEAIAQNKGEENISVTVIRSGKNLDLKVSLEGQKARSSL